MKRSLIIFFLLLPVKGFSGIRNVDQSVAISAAYTSYSELGSRDAGQPPLDPIYLLDLNFSLYSVFEITLMGGKTFKEEIDPDTSKADIRQIIGLGFRVGLPGFFFYKAKSNDLIQRGRKYPVQTYVSVLALRVSRKDTSSSVTTTESGNQVGFGMDIFLFQPKVFLNTEAAFYTVGGDASIAAKVGLGLAF